MRSDASFMPGADLGCAPSVDQRASPSLGYVDLNPVATAAVDRPSGTTVNSHGLHSALGTSNAVSPDSCPSSDPLFRVGPDYSRPTSSASATRLM